MTKEIELPDGSIAEFPDEMPDVEIESVLQRQFGGGAQAMPGPVDLGHNVPAFDPGVPGYDPATGMVAGDTSKIGQTGAYLSGTAKGLPVIGPTVEKGQRLAAAGLAKATGADEPFWDIYSDMNRMTLANEQANPGYATAGNVTGQVAGSLGVMGAAPRVFGAAAGQTLPWQIGMGAVGNVGLTAADIAARGETPTTRDVLISGGAGVAGPVVGQALKGAYAVGKPILSRANAIFRPSRAGAADKVIAESIEHGMRGKSITDEASYRRLRAEGQPVTNVDVLGGATRQLASEAASVSPEVREAAENLIEGRHKTQFTRVGDALKKLVGSNTNRAQVRETIDRVERETNAPLYKAAEMSPAAQEIWTPEIQRLTADPNVQQAINEVEKFSKKVAVREGGLPVKNPFVQKPDGTLELKSTGERARLEALKARRIKSNFPYEDLDEELAALPDKPSLRFWDMVKRKLGSQEEATYRNAGATEGGLVRDVRKSLVAELDNLVPEYKQARGTAAEFFKTENSIEAGEELATGSHTLEELAENAIKFKPHERQAMKVGFVGKLLERMGERGDPTDLLRMLETPNFRKKIELVFGPDDAKQVEHLIATEALFSKANSVIVKQSHVIRNAIIQGGAAGGGLGGVYALTTGDIKGAAAFTLAGVAVPALKRKGLERLMTEVGEKLISGDPAKVKAAMEIAAHSRENRAAVMKFIDRLSIGVRATGLPAAQAGEQ